MTEADIHAALTAIFREAFADPAMVLTPALSAADVPGWDSFRQIEIIVATEQRFGIKMHTRDLDALKNVGDLVRAVASKTGVV